MTRRQLRAAVYTRKSSEEGLEQSFNSLDAQREACEAFVRSQAAEGWVLVHDRYDDGGLSGGTLERPALQQLLRAVEAAEIDIVVVYKVDRLTRSLADFAKIVELFDARGVSFVSVTQQFNTTTSMGRLTLNVLLSFAQFEREVTGERIRDKIAASKRKGMWMGGHVPFGYKVEDRSLAIEPAEVATVREIFRIYLEQGCVRRLREVLVEAGLRTRSGRAFSRGHLYRILANPLYIGEIVHKDRRYQGQHAAIVESQVWEAVQARLAGNRVARRNGTNAKEPSLLAGLLHDERGQPFTPSHAVKGGRRYRYYVERRAIAESGTPGEPSLRIPATEIERVVVDALLDLLRSPARVIELCGLDQAAAAEVKRVSCAAQALAARLAEEPSERQVNVRTLVDRAVLSDKCVTLELAANALHEALGLPSTDADSMPAPRFEVPVRLARRGVETCVIHEGSTAPSEPAPDPTLIRAVVRAHDWFDRLLSGEAPSLKAIAESEGTTDRYVRRLLPLAFLDPDLTRAILDGRQPADLSLERLAIHDDLPLSWAIQRSRYRLT